MKEDTDSVEISEEMIEAGVEELRSARLVRENEWCGKDAERAVSQIYSAMQSMKRVAEG